VLYLLDANILITAANTYYGIARVPEFWSWLEHQGGSGHIKIPVEMYEEVLEGRKEGDELLGWVKSDAVRGPLLFEEVSNADLVRKVVREGVGAKRRPCWRVFRTNLLPRRELRVTMSSSDSP
jgi:Domain of unknown function (DUF4411)